MRHSNSRLSVLCGAASVLGLAPPINSRNYVDLVDQIEANGGINGLGNGGLAQLAANLGLGKLGAGGYVPSIVGQNLEAWISDAMTAYALTRAIPKTFAVEAVPITYFHRLDYAVAGFTAPISFFQVAPSDFISNFDGGAGLPPNYGFMLDSIGIDVERGVTAAGVHAATPTNSVSVNADSDNVLIASEAIRRILDGGRVKFSIGQKEFCDMYGLKNFSTGTGIDMAGQTSDTTTAAADRRRALVHVGNGSPFSANRGYTFPRPVPILPGDRPKITVGFQSAIPIPIASVLRAQMTGVLFRYA